MADSGAAHDYPVHLGVWTNWSIGGHITGSTITLTHRNGALLTAFIAIFVTFTGSRLWRILCFILHQILRSPLDTPQDGLYHQRQMILRNTLDEKKTLTSLVRSLLAWRQKADRPFYRMLPLLILSLVITILLALSSVFSAKISSIMGNEVLIASSECGSPGFTNSTQLNATAEQLASIYTPWQSERMTSYANYAQRCYSNTSQSESCVPFVKTKLKSSVDRNATCPFQEKVCRHRDGNIKLDTGYMNSQSDLGLNGPPDYQFNLRLLTHCAPLKDNDHRSVVRHSGRQYVRYNYGYHIPKDGDISRLNNSLYTFQVEQLPIEDEDFQIITDGLEDYRIE